MSSRFQASFGELWRVPLGPPEEGALGTRGQTKTLTARRSPEPWARRIEGSTFVATVGCSLDRVVQLPGMRTVDAGRGETFPSRQPLPENSCLVLEDEGVGARRFQLSTAEERKKKRRKKREKRKA